MLCWLADAALVGLFSLGIYELIVVDDEMRQLIHDRASEAALTRHARSATPSIRQDGWRKVMAGETSIEEVLRVTREN